MGPVSKHNLNIAPAFYSTQCDLAGPFKSYSHSNKRATVNMEVNNMKHRCNNKFSNHHNNTSNKVVDLGSWVDKAIKEAGTAVAKIAWRLVTLLQHKQEHKM